MRLWITLDKIRFNSLSKFVICACLNLWFVLSLREYKTFIFIFLSHYGFCYFPCCNVSNFNYSIIFMWYSHFALMFFGGCWLDLVHEKNYHHHKPILIQSSLLKVESIDDKSHLFLLQIHLKSHLDISEDNLIDIHAHFMIYKTKTLVHNEVPSLDKNIYIYFTLLNEASLQWIFLLNSTQPNHSD